MRAGLLLVALMVLPGCAQRPPDGVSFGVIAAPLWAVGDSWNYTISDGAGAVFGWINYTVVGARAIAGASDRAYEVRVTHHDRAFRMYSTLTDPLVRNVFYDAATLNLVLPACGTYGDGPPCRDPELDFPLWDNKTWESKTAGGDVIARYINRATLVPANSGEASGIVRVERRAVLDEWPPQVDLYDLHAGFYVERHNPSVTHAPVSADATVWTLQQPAMLAQRQPRAGTPVWKPGWAWNYTIQDEAGAPLGWVRYTVKGIEAVPDVTERAYRVLVERFDAADVDHDGVGNESTVRTMWFDVANLNTVWNECGRPGGLGACKGRDADLDFPLWENKTWNSSSGGDVIVGMHHEASLVDHDGAALWRLVATAPGMGGWEPRVELFDPDEGFYRERHLPGEVWTLQGA